MKATPAPLRPVSAVPGLPLDAATWAALLHTAGPQDAVWLVRQIVADLGRMQGDLTLALDGWDGTAERSDLRRASHALAGLGGTIGAPGLHGSAMRLNQLLHRADAATVAQAGQAVLNDLALLIPDVMARLRAMGAT